jgi:hypothetical protein
VTKRWTFVVAALTALGIATPLAAQTITSPYEFVERSQALYAYTTYVIADRGVIGTGPGGGPALGAGYSWRVSGPFTVDARLAHLWSSRTVYRLEDPQPDPEQIREDPMVGLDAVGDADLSLLLAEVSLRFDITGPRTWNDLQPFALIGAGGIFRTTADHSIEEEWDIGEAFQVRFRNGATGHVGAGAEWFVTPRFTVRAEARNVLWRTHVPSGFITSARVIDDREWVQTGHFSVGVGFRF